MWYSSPILTKEYSIVGFRQVATLPGSVQVVVVQMTIQALSSGTPYLASTPLGSLVSL